MSGNYPDGLSDGSPHAPWNQRDPDALTCDACGEEPKDDCAELGGACQNTQLELDAAGNEIPPCTGRYQSRLCDRCLGIGIHCSCD